MISVCIPTYGGMPDKTRLLSRCLESLWEQTFQDFEIVVTDNSDDDALEDVCRYYSTGIRYYRNPERGMARNTNEAIRRSRGTHVKILYMDDFMANPDALARIVRKMDGEWLVTGCTHTITGEERFNNHQPRFSEDIHLGNNTIGSPSVLTVRNEHPMLFDENLGFLLDCDYYRRMRDRFGEPTYLREVSVVIGIHEGQQSNVMEDERKLQEFQYMINKYA